MAVFLGHLTTDDIEYSHSISKNNIGGACLYASLAYSLWGEGANLISVIGVGYDTEKFEKICAKHCINIENVFYQDRLRGIELCIKYDLDKEHEFIKKAESGDYITFAPKVWQINNNVVLENKYYHISPIPVYCQILLAKKIRRLRKDSYISIDPAIEDLCHGNIAIWKELFEYIDMLILNRKEWFCFLEMLQEKRVFASVAFGMKDIQSKYNINSIIIKCGDEGVWAINEKSQLYRCYAIKENCIDSTGAGDSFAGGFIYSIEHARGFQEALKIGAASSAKAISKIGIEGLIKSDE